MNRFSLAKVDSGSQLWFLTFTFLHYDRATYRTIRNTIVPYYTTFWLFGTIVAEAVLESRTLAPLARAFYIISLHLIKDTERATLYLLRAVANCARHPHDHEG